LFFFGLNIFVSIIVSFFVFLGGNVEAYNIENEGICTCESCLDCTNALNDDVCQEVRLTRDITNQSGTCIYDPPNFNNKIFNCQGNKIEGDNSGFNFGIFLDGRKTKNTIKNCVISKFAIGIYLYRGAEYNTITNNILDNNEEGIRLEFSSHNILTNNTANNNRRSGIYLRASYNTLTNNIMNNNGNGIEVNGLDFNLSLSQNYNIITGNTANDNIENGIYLWGSSNNILANNIANNNKNGIDLHYSSNYNFITNNTATNNDNNGIYLFSSSNNTITSNTVNNNDYGISLLVASNFNKILGNKISDNKEAGITLTIVRPNYCGIEHCSDKNLSNTIEGNKILNNKIGIFSQESSSTINGNVVCGNTELDFTSSDWLSSSGENNICDKPDGWYDTGTTGCRYLCSTTPIQRWLFETDFQYNLDSDYETVEGTSHLAGEVTFLAETLSIEGQITIDGSLPSVTPTIYLIATDGLKSEISSTTVPFSSVIYSKIEEKTYSFSVLISNPSKPENGGHYEVYLEIEGKPFFIKTNSRINKNYLPLINLPEKMVLISEVYYDVAKGNDPDNEWVIIHNLENEEVDLKDWKICSQNKKENCNNLEGAIPANGFAILTPTSTTFSFWKIPEGMTKIVLGKKFGSYGLNNKGDNLILKNEKGEIVDAMSYGTDNSIFNPPCPTVPEGKSLLRDPPEKDTDTALDFKESEPTISNKLPIPVINFSPKNPVKGVKVKFDASSSTDLDGEIKEFFWEIKRGEEILATSTATTTNFAFPENGQYQITLTATDNDGSTSSTSTTIKVEPFSFAIITDLHIGRGYPDYDGPGFDDGYNGEEYYLTQRLRNVVKWINENKENYSFKFVAVLGDIADTAEKSEFCKAKEILDQLEIPYVPIFGNHDVWPYTEKEPAPGPLGEDFFEKIFWSTSSIPCENASSTKNFETLLREFNFERDIQNPKFKNFAFNFGGINFIGLDFNSREKEKCENCGVKGEGVVHNEAISWLKDKLNKLGGKEPVIIFSHEPFAKPYSRWLYSEFPPLLPDKRGNFDSKEIEEVQKILNEYEALSEGQQILANFGGHIHGFEKFGKEKISISPVDLFMAGNWEYPSLSNISVVTTEALMVGTNEKDEDLNKPKYDKGILRIVRILGSDEIDFNETAAKYNPEAGNGKEFVALNPYISWAYKFLENSSNPCIFLKSHPFTNRDISSFEWELGNGEKRYGKVIPLYCYSATGTYTITSTVTDAKTGWKEWITRKIEIKEGLISKIIKIKNELKEKVEIISQKMGENLLEFGNYLIKGKDRILLKVKHSPSTPVAELIIDFDEANSDIDLSQMIFDSNLREKKSILYMPEWPKVVKEKILLLPK